MRQLPTIRRRTKRHREHIQNIASDYGYGKASGQSTGATYRNALKP